MMEGKNFSLSDQTQTLLDEQVCQALANQKIVMPLQSTYGGRLIRFAVGDQSHDHQT